MIDPTYHRTPYFRHVTSTITERACLPLCIYSYTGQRDVHSITTPVGYIHCTCIYLASLFTVWFVYRSVVNRTYFILSKQVCRFDILGYGNPGTPHRTFLTGSVVLFFLWLILKAYFHSKTKHGKTVCKVFEINFIDCMKF